jgi:hypothetical protein
MSSLTRRIQIRGLKKLGKFRLPIVTRKGNVVGFKWAVRPRQLFFLTDLTPVLPGDTHPTLQPVIDALTPKEQPVAQAA